MILHRGRASDTEATLRSLGGAADPVVVVAHAQQEEGPRPASPPARTLLLPRDHGFAGAVNRGMAAAREAGAGDVLLLEAGTTLEPGALAALDAAARRPPPPAGRGAGAGLGGGGGGGRPPAGGAPRGGGGGGGGPAPPAAARPDAAAVGPRLIEAGGGGRTFFDGGRWDPVGGITLDSAGNPPETRETGFLPFRALLLPRAGWDALGTLDETFFARGDDLDWCARAAKGGRPLLLCGSAAARCADDPLAGPADPPGLYLDARNRVLLALRHSGAARRRLLFWPRTLLAAAPRVALRLATGRRAEARALLRGLRDGLRPERPAGFKEFFPLAHHVPRPVERPARAGEGDGLPALRGMLEEMKGAPAIVQPSAYWEFLNELNLDQLAGSGFAEFKRTVNQNYFHFLPAGMGSDQFRTVLRRWLARPTGPVLSARVLDPGYFEDHTWRDNPFRSGMRRKGYAAFVAMLWEVARRSDARGLLDRLEEPDLGHPLSVLHRGRRISQDLCNSVLEANAMLDGLPGNAVGGNGVLELGAGYGRVAWVLLEQDPTLRYFIVDIPPALAIAQEYLTRLFPGRPAFRFCRFTRYEDVRAEMEEARIGFLTPNQLALVPPWGAGLFVNISSLHEMRPEQIAHYLGEVGKHTAGFFYTKQWERSVNPYDRVVIRREDYPIPKEWETVFLRKHPVQRLFFEAMYRVMPPPY